MALTGKQKAAMLLMSLDAGTASELLKGVDAQVVQELAVELAHLDAAGYRSNKQNAEVARQFCDSLQTKQVFHLNSFLNEMLKNTVGVDKAEQIQTQIQDMLYKRDGFIPIRSVDTRTIAAVLEYEHPQAAAVVLSELPAKKSSEVLGLLGEGIRVSAISRMTESETMTPEAKAQIARTVCKHLGAVTSGGASGASARPEQSQRKVAVLLRNLGKELREGLLGAIQKADDQAGAKVADLMIIWDDVPQVADRSLQEALRAIDAKQLALALFKADEVIAEKIRSNISKQAAAALDEQASLMVTPEKEDVESARAKVIKTLAETDKKIGLAFTEGEIG